MHRQVSKTEAVRERGSENNILLRAGSHAGEGRRRAELDEALKFEVLEEDVLGLDPAHGRGELVRKELDEDRVTELVAVLGGAPLLFVPRREDLVQARRRSLGVDALGVLLVDLVRDGGQVGDVTTDEKVGVEVRRVDLLRQVGTERHDTGPEVARVERHVDTGERDRREAALESNEAGLGLQVARLLNALVDNLAQVLLDLLDRHGLGKLDEVDLLDLEEVEDVANGGARTKKFSQLCRKRTRRSGNNTHVSDWRATR